jgi:hypothetical protein
LEEMIEGFWWKGVLARIQKLNRMKLFKTSPDALPCCYLAPDCCHFSVVLWTCDSNRCCLLFSVSSFFEILFCLPFVSLFLELSCVVKDISLSLVRAGTHPNSYTQDQVR